MIAQEATKVALIAALEGHAPLAGALNGIYATPPVRATPPYLVVGEVLAADWSTKTEAGRELRLAVTIHEEAGRAERFDGLMAGAEAAIAAMDRDPPGWRIASLVFLRARVVRGEGPWAGLIEYRARLLAA